MKILVINCGSSTIKFQLYNMDNNEVIAKGRCEKIGLESSNIIYKNLRDSISYEKPEVINNHKQAMEVLIRHLTDEKQGVIKSFDDISAVGHRVVHGGEKFSKATLIEEEVISEIEKLCEIAPLHNPGALIGIKAIKNIDKDMINVAVFDTAFHQSIPIYNFLYAIKYEYYEKHGIRRYGFHGSSYMYILNRLSEKLNKPKNEINAIVCHLGSGASICAIKNGLSYDTSMGFSPLEGLVMETRSGDLDPAIVTKIMEIDNLSIKEVSEILNKESGRLGICGIGDHRQLMEAANSGDSKAILAEQIQTNRTKKYIGSYMAELNRVDAIVFTGGIGENDSCERQMITSDMEYLGINIDENRNIAGSGKESLISSDNSRISVYVIPTDEEFEIAKQTEEIYIEFKR
ncbi:MAG: acetate kinase [Clostridia bacterium]|nr:acetate kinase [Clostridia bacterium]MDD4386846.1 acetate kinase [Clostridia bacterium]